MTGAASRMPFLDKSVNHLAALIKTTYIQWDTAHKEGLFQKLDARVKVLFLLFFIIIVSVKRTLLPEVAIGGLVFILAVVSRLDLLSFYGRVLFLGFVFGFLIALPSCLNIVVEGEVIMPIMHLSEPYQFWVYRIPETIGITRQGLDVVFILTLRVINSLSISFLVIYTTPFQEIMKALKSLRVPDTFLMIITLSYKYIFIFAQTFEDIHLAKKGRTVKANAAEARSWVAGRMGFLLRRTRTRCEEVFNAMLARGFCGEVAIHNWGKVGKMDIMSGAGLLLAGCFVLFI
jgi:cobalt ECF transporter T component CbiQ